MASEFGSPPMHLTQQFLARRINNADCAQIDHGVFAR